VVSINPGQVILLLVGLLCIFAPGNGCSCNHCTTLYTIRALVGILMIGLSLKGTKLLKQAVSEGADEPTESRFLRICPHCGQNTLKNQAECVCGKK
jgi:hypothetical protein